MTAGVLGDQETNLLRHQWHPEADLARRGPLTPCTFTVNPSFIEKGRDRWRRFGDVLVTLDEVSENAYLLPSRKAPEELSDPAKLKIAKFLAVRKTLTEQFLESVGKQQLRGLRFPMRLGRDQRERIQVYSEQFDGFLRDHFDREANRPAIGRVFIVHGRDLPARDALVACCEALGLLATTFDQVARTAGAPTYVPEIVMRGISEADATIVLFTPDEQAAFYDPVSAELQPKTRWQSRPNVIFEAGVALGANPKKTILANLGTDLAGLTNVSGIHLVELSSEEGPRLLYERLALLSNFPTPKMKRAAIAAADKLKNLLRPRWKPYDEGATMMEALQAMEVFDDDDATALDCVRAVVTELPLVNWRGRTPKSFCLRLEKRYGKDAANILYWYLFGAGFFQPNNIDKLFAGQGTTWLQGVPYAEFSERGHHLIERLRCMVSDPYRTPSL